MIAATRTHELTQSQYVMELCSLLPSRIIMTVPHDGLNRNDLTGLFAERAYGIKGRDAYTWPVAKDIALLAHLTALRGLVPRHFIDYNRGQPETPFVDRWSDVQHQRAFDDLSLTKHYLEYHDRISERVTEAITRFGKQRVVLIDIHGFSTQPPYAPDGGYDIILGTGNCSTVPHCNLDQTFTAFMRSRGYRVFLPGESYVSGRTWYSAGFTTYYYAKTFGITAMQIETHNRFRKRDTEQLGKKLAADIAVCLSEI